MKQILALALLLVAACSDVRNDGQVDVSVIGGDLRPADVDHGPLSPAEAVLANATAMGLVAIDANGQVEPALAESWIGTGDGLSIIFRIRPAQWPDGRDVTGDDVAASLNRALRPDSRNPLRPLLTAVDAVVGMTGRVVEIRLKTPRPNLLQLLAQPELAIRRNGAGAGPLRIVATGRSSLTLRPVRSDDDDTSSETVAEPIRLRSERASLAIARFVADQSDLVLGGTLGDFPILQAAKVRPGRVRFDPVQGLFGLAIVGEGSFLASSDLRDALAMAIDRNALADAVGIPGWTVTDTVLPAQFDSAQPPARPDWQGTSLAQRRADATARIAAWRGGAKSLPPLRVALPPGPGMRVLFARLAADWRLIGVSAVAVPLKSPDADLRLIDAVAPNSSANWYLTRLSCASGLVCDSRGDTALEASRDAATLAERAARLADADSVATSRGNFIPLGVPIRWSLVDPALTGWKENIFAIHPLTELRPGPGGG